MSGPRLYREAIPVRWLDDDSQGVLVLHRPLTQTTTDRELEAPLELLGATRIEEQEAA